MDTINDSIQSRLAEAGTYQLRQWLGDAQSDLSTYLVGKPWFTAPMASPKYIEGEKLAAIVRILARELAIREDMLREKILRDVEFEMAYATEAEEAVA